MRDALFTPASPRLAAMAAAVLAMAFLIPAWGVMLVHPDQGRGAFDQNRYHLRAIERFSQQWPAFDFSDYESATTPGYHVVLATVHRFVSDDVAHLRVLASLVTAALLALLAWVIARRMGAAPALALGAPMAASLYIFSAGAWLLPDNAAWLGVLGLLLLALRACDAKRTIDVPLLIGGGAVLVALVLVRQVHLWAAALVWLAAWLGTSPQASLLKPLDLERRMSRTALALLATLPAFAVVFWFLYLWGGPVPPMFQPGGGIQEHDLRANPATPALMLSLVGIFATFYAGLLWPAIRNGILNSARAKAVLAGAVAVGVVLATVPETTYSVEAGRWSGLWNLVLQFDVRGIAVAERSPLIILLSALGAMWIAAWWLALGARDRWIFLVAWCAFLAAQTATSEAWQRYHEPFILMMLALFAARLPRDGQRAWALAGPLVLALLLAAVTVASLR